jgi:aminopeptidase N
MSGKPKEARLVAALTKRAVLELGEGSTALDYVCHFVEGGKMLSDLAAEMAAEMQESCSRQLLSGAAHALGPDAKERIAAARQEGAVVLVEETIAIADASEATAGGAAKARVQIGSRQWAAERFNAAQFSATTKVQGSVLLGTLMLEALRQPPPPSPFLTEAHVLPVDMTEEATVLTDHKEGLETYVN